MNSFWMHVLDKGLFVFHIIVIGFNLTGWIWPKSRRIHLWVLGLTTASWFILGIWFGLGYCFLTDWHWDIKRQLGEWAMPDSFIQYLFEGLGFSIRPHQTDWITGLAFVGTWVGAIYVNFFRQK